LARNSTVERYLGYQLAAKVFEDGALLKTPTPDPLRNVEVTNIDKRETLESRHLERRPGLRVGFGKPPPRKQTQGRTRLVLEMSARWGSSSARGLWKTHLLLREVARGPVAFVEGELVLLLGRRVMDEAPAHRQPPAAALSTNI
jgi:hypothetical protein